MDTCSQTCLHVRQAGVRVASGNGRGRLSRGRPGCCNRGFGFGFLCFLLVRLSFASSFACTRTCTPRSCLRTCNHWKSCLQTCTCAPAGVRTRASRTSDVASARYLISASILVLASVLKLSWTSLVARRSCSLPRAVCFWSKVQFLYLLPRSFNCLSSMRTGWGSLDLPPGAWGPLVFGMTEMSIWRVSF